MQLNQRQILNFGGTHKLTRYQGVIELLRNPEQKKELLEKPELVPNFVNELCRYHTASAHAMKRVAKEEVEIGGKVSITQLPIYIFFRYLSLFFSYLC